VHGYYWNDDQPMLYFADVRNNPAYCASHVVPLEELSGDLASAATTPNFAWIAPDDCSDMEGCGIAAGDAFLKAELTQIMNSPAWRDQRSLAIITFDEDAQDYQHPAQHVPTIVIGSQGVRPGVTDSTRYTHYSLLRTVEAALGLGTLFAFSPGAGTLYVASFGADSVTPIDTATNRPGAALSAGYAPDALAATSAGLYAVDGNSDEVTQLGSQATTRVGYSPTAIAVSGTTAYVANSIDSTVTPLNTRTGKAAAPISVGTYTYPTAIALSGTTAIVIEPYGDSVTLIDTQTNHAYPPIPVGAFPGAVTITG
jgi:hypothetical protein